MGHGGRGGADGNRGVPVTHARPPKEKSPRGADKGPSGGGDQQSPREISGTQATSQQDPLEAQHASCRREYPRHCTELAITAF